MNISSFSCREDLVLLKRLMFDKWRKYAPRYAVSFIFMFVVADTTALSAWLMKDVINLIFVDRKPDALADKMEGVRELVAPRLVDGPRGAGQTNIGKRYMDILPAPKSIDSRSG